MDIVQTKRINNIHIKKEHSMSSHPSHQRQVAEIERESVHARINLYKQMKEQLLSQMKLYQRQRKKNWQN